MIVIIKLVANESHLLLQMVLIIIIITKKF